MMPTSADARLAGRLTHLGEWLDRRLFGNGPDTAPCPRLWTVLLTLAAVAIGAVLTVPIVVVSAIQTDIYIPLDALARMLSGGVPHADWPTPLGPLYHAGLLAGAWVRGPNATALPGMHALAALCMLPLALLATRDRLAPAVRAVMVAFLVLWVASPRLADGGAFAIAWLAVYNRWGSALAVLALLLALVPPGKHRGIREEGAEGILLGAVALACAYVKAPFALALVPAFAVGLLAPGTRRIVLAGAFASALCFAILWTTDLLWTRGYLADLGHVAHAQLGNHGRRGWGKLWTDTVQSWPLIASTITALALTLASGRFWRPVLACAAAFLVALFIANQTHDFVCGVVVALPGLTAAILAQNGAPRLAARVAALAFMAGGLHAFALDAAASIIHRVIAETPQPMLIERGDLVASRLSWGQRDTSHAPPGLADILAGKLDAEVFLRSAHGLKVSDHETARADAVNLLHRSAPGVSRPVAVEFSASLVVREGYAPARGWPAWLDYGRTVSEAAPPTVAWLHDADAVLLPTDLLAKTIGAVPTVRLFRPVIAEAGFTQLAETPLWTLWMRPAGAETAR